MIITTIAVTAVSRHATRDTRWPRTARSTSDVNRGDAVARGSRRIAFPISLSFIGPSDPPRFELLAHQRTRAKDPRLHRADAATQRAGDLVVRPFFDFKEDERRPEL